MTARRTLLQRIATDPRVESVFSEHDEFDGKTWWIYLRSGYVCPEMECGTIHERTLTECAALLRSVVTEDEYNAKHNAPRYEDARIFHGVRL